MEPYEVALRAMWRELAEKRIEHGVDWPRIVLTLFGDIEAAQRSADNRFTMFQSAQREITELKARLDEASA